jgi:hypothetical protein
MPKINIKILASCLNFDDKEKLFKDLEGRGAIIEDHKIDFNISEIKIWASVYKENFNKFETSLFQEHNNFTIMSASRGRTKKLKR